MSTAIEGKSSHADAEVQVKIDFKMVTFTLAGKDYGIDIMQVKEISRARHFTYVPNTAPYVRGVYNLRGEIISIIDLRIMFNLPAHKKQDETLEDILILRMEDHVIGVVVDSIDKVVGVASEHIQPPHPLFADVNIKYIEGVVEENDKLYIILDVYRVFNQSQEEPEEEPLQDTAAEEGVQDRVYSSSNRNVDIGVDLGFIIDTLRTFRGFYVTSLNEDWIKSRFEQWKALRGEGADLQLKEKSDADEYLKGFFSEDTGRLWSEPYMEELEKLLPATEYSSFNVWNPGCSKGFETYALAVVLRRRYRDARLKVWASDNDLLNISAAPSLSFQNSEYPAAYEGFLQETGNRKQFNSAIKDIITFEFHDIMNNNPIEGLDMILTRDLLSYLSPDKQKRVLTDFREKLKPGGILVLGDNEKLNQPGWTPLKVGKLVAFRKDSN